MSAAVEMIGVTKDYGRVRAVDDLSLSIPEGSLYGLIGPNGAGKTTTFALLGGFLRPTKGEIRIRGRQLSPGLPPVGQVLSLPQDATLPNHKRVLECLIFLAQLGGMSGAEARQKSEQALKDVGLSELADRKLSQLSHGQRRRVGIAQTLVGHDEVIMLDEPTAGLDPRTALELGQLIQSLHARRTIVLSSHNLSEVETLCTHAAILSKGKLVASGTMDEIKGTGQLLLVALGQPLSNPAALQALATIVSVRAVNPSPDGTGIEIKCGDPTLADQVTTEVLKVLIQHGAQVKGVERGKKLEQRFLETTAPTSG